MTTSDTPAAAGQPANSPEDLKLVQAYTAWLASKNIVLLSGEAQPIKAEAGERRFFVVHPSRTAPKCTDCRHIESKYQQNCCHPAQPCYLEDGRSMVRARFARGDAAVCTARGFAHCGEAGALFEPISDSPATFAQLWLTGALPLPITPCTAEQLYRAYRNWCGRTNVKWPPDQARFTAAIKEAQPQLRYEVVGSVTTSLKRLWLPTAALPGKHDIDAFDSALVRWIQSPPDPGGR